MLKRTLSVVLASLTLLMLAGAGSSYAETGGVRVGTLECSVEGRRGFLIGSSQTLGCTFRHAANMPEERYRGTMTIVGIDIGLVGEARMVWRVLAPTSDVGPGALAGRYSGVSARVTAAVGVSANALVGGFNQSIVLNPLSLGAQTGVNVAAGVSRLRLESVQP